MADTTKKSDEEIITAFEKAGVGVTITTDKVGSEALVPGKTTETMETREERVAAMTAALVSEEPLTEEEVEDSFVDMDPSGAAIYVQRVGESSETDDPVWDDCAPERDDDGSGVLDDG